MIQLPETFSARMREMLSQEEYEAYLASFERKASSAVRINTAKISPEEFEKLTDFHLRPVPWIANGFFYADEDAPSKHPFYYAGLYYLQEPSAMTPANRMPVEAGDRILDLCAAPGGKSTELAAKLAGTGVLVANDISNSRAKALLKNLELFGVPNALIVNEAPNTLAAHFTGYFDKILVDAPCSGEGMFRKQPSIMKNWEQYGTGYYNKLQKEILPFAVQMLKPGGILLYSTCTFSAEEDEETIAWLLQEYEELELIPAIKEEELSHYLELGFSMGRPDLLAKPDARMKYCIRLFPHKLEGEGHFLAILKKREDAAGGSFVPFTRYANANKLPAEFLEFLSHTTFPIDKNRLYVRDDRYYLLPEGIPSLDGIRTLRTGLFLGEAKKGRFEPSQAFACALKAEEWDSVYSLPADDPDVIRYLKCETIELKKPVKDGYVLICVEGYPLGFAKVKNNNMKNKYLPGWRLM